MFIDSHCHLNYKGLIEDQQGVLERARAAGVETMLNISPRASEWNDVIGVARSEEHTSELQSLMRISYAVFCSKTKTKTYSRISLHKQENTNYNRHTTANQQL